MAVSSALNWSSAAYPSTRAGRRLFQSSAAFLSTLVDSPHNALKLILFRYRNASSQPLLAVNFSICKLDAISAAFACSIRPVTGMFRALHFMKNFSIILLTSTFSVFLIFSFLFSEQLLSTAFITECSFFLMFAFVALTRHTVRQAYADFHLC